MEAVSSICEALGTIELRWDLKVLISGDNWKQIVRKEIKNSDSFQLFWSKNAKASTQVEKEWKFALKLKRSNFIKPVYWESPMPDPPKTLDFGSILRFFGSKVANCASCRPGMLPGIFVK